MINDTVGDAIGAPRAARRTVRTGTWSDAATPASPSDCNQVLNEDSSDEVSDLPLMETV